MHRNRGSLPHTSTGSSAGGSSDGGSPRTSDQGPLPTREASVEVNQPPILTVYWLFLTVYTSLHHWSPFLLLTLNAWDCSASVTSFKIDSRLFSSKGIPGPLQAFTMASNPSEASTRPSTFDAGDVGDRSSRWICFQHSISNI